jgi:hypothetical protein
VRKRCPRLDRPGLARTGSEGEAMTTREQTAAYYGDTEVREVLTEITERREATATAAVRESFARRESCTGDMIGRAITQDMSTVYRSRETRDVLAERDTADTWPNR